MVLSDILAWLNSLCGSRGKKEKYQLIRRRYDLFSQARRRCPGSSDAPQPLGLFCGSCDLRCWWFAHIRHSSDMTSDTEIISSRRISSEPSLRICNKWVIGICDREVLHLFKRASLYLCKRASLYLYERASLYPILEKWISVHSGFTSSWFDLFRPIWRGESLNGGSFMHCKSLFSSYHYNNTTHFESPSLFKLGSPVVWS